jgi:hypothetical protein
MIIILAIGDEILEAKLPVLCLRKLIGLVSKIISIFKHQKYSGFSLYLVIILTMTRLI